MKILVITREIPPVGGGAGHVALNLAQRLATQGHPVDILTMYYGNLPYYEERNAICIRRIDCKRKHQDSSYHIDMVRFVIKGIPYASRMWKLHNYDLIHAHAIIPDGFMGICAGRKNQIPVIVTAHGSDVPGFNPTKFQLSHKILAPFWRFTLKKFAAVTCPSNFLKELIQQSRKVQQVEVIPNGIDIDTFSQTEKDGSFLIVSRLVKRKNFHLFLEALKSITRPQKVHVAGDGPMKPQLERLAAEIPQHDIQFYGWLPNGSLKWKQLYERSTYFVFLSERENFPINLLEAQLAGLVVIASPISGNKEVLGSEAVYVKSFDVNEIARTIHDLINGGLVDVPRLSENSRAWVKENFSWENIVVRYLSVYQQILNESCS